MYRERIVYVSYDGSEHDSEEKAYDKSVDCIRERLDKLITKNAPDIHRLCSMACVEALTKDMIEFEKMIYSIRAIIDFGEC